MTTTPLERAERRKAWGFALPALLFTVAFFLVPFLYMAAISFWKREGREIVASWTLDNYVAFFGKPHLLKALFNSLEVTAIVTVISIVLAYPLAWIIAERVPRRWQRFALIMAILPFWTSYVVRSYSWLLVLSGGGVVNQALMWTGLIAEPLELSANRVGTVIGFVHFFVMLLTLTIYANLVQLSPNYRRAAADLGANGFQTFWHVILPLTAARHHGRRLPDLRPVHRRLHHAADSRRQQRARPAAGHYAAAWPPRRFPDGRRPLAGADGGGDDRLSGLSPLAEDGEDLTMRHINTALSALYASALYLFIFLPVAVLVLFSFQDGTLPVPPLHGLTLRWYGEIFADAKLMSALGNSLIVAIVSSAIACVIGFFAAYAFARYTLPGSGLQRALIVAPMTVSTLIIGLGLLSVFSRLNITLSLWTVGIGHVVINLPLCFAIIYASMGGHQVNIERAARDLGAKDWQVMVLVTAPMLMPSILAAFFLSVTFSWDEFIVAFLLSRFDVTLPVEIWSMLRSGLDPKTNAIGSVVFLISVAFLIVMELAVFRKSGNSK